MKLRIQYAGKAVGLLSLFAALILISLIALLAAKHRWFKNDYHYTTLISTAAGLSHNMHINYKGFSIGSLKSFVLLESGDVKIDFIIYDEYRRLAKENSLIEVQISPIGLGNQFLFYPGNGPGALPEKSLVPPVNSKEGKIIIAAGMCDIPQSGDSISIMLSRVNNVLSALDGALRGDGGTTLGRSFLSIESSLAEINSLAAGINYASAGLKDSSGALYKNLENSAASLAGILENLDKTSSYLPPNMPQVGAAISDLRASLHSAEDVLSALSNNPVLKKGVAQRVQIGPPAGSNSRNVEF